MNSCIIKFFSVTFSIYRKVASSSLSPLVAYFQIFKRLMKGKFDAYVICTVTFGQKVPKLNSRPVYCLLLATLWYSNHIGYHCHRFVCRANGLGFQNECLIELLLVLTDHCHPVKSSNSFGMSHFARIQGMVQINHRLNQDHGPHLHHQIVCSYSAKHVKNLKKGENGKSE